MSLFKKLFALIFPGERLCPEKRRVGEIPDRNTLYQTALHIAWPATVESVLVGLVGIVDTVMVSACGTAAIAAVGLTTQPKFIVLAVFMALNVGVTAVVARRIGQEDIESAKATLRQSLTVCLVLLAVVTTLGYIFSRDILLFAGAGADTIDDADIYLKIILLGIPFTALSLIINAAHRGAGNTKISMVTNLTANGVNIIFNYLLIGGNLGFPKLGVAGAAIATSFGFFIAFLISLYTIVRPGSKLHISLFKDSFIPRKETMKSVANVGSSAGVEQVFMRIGFLTYAMIIAGLGTDAFATHQICMTILSFSFTFGEGFSVAATSLVGQNMGKGRPDLSLIYGKICQRMSLFISIFVALGFLFLRVPIIGLFTQDGNIIREASVIFILMALISPPQMSQVVLFGGLRGAGDSKYTAIMSFISITIIRPGLSYLLCYPFGFGLIGAWVGLLLDQIVRFTLSSYRFYRCRWFKIKL